MRKILVGLLLMACTTTAFSVVVDVQDIATGYNKLDSSVEDLEEAIKETNEQYKLVLTILEAGTEKQLQNEALVGSTRNTLVKVGNQTSAFVKAEVLRGESLLLRNKEMLIEIWRMSQDISKEDIIEMFAHE